MSASHSTRPRRGGNHSTSRMNQSLFKVPQNAFLLRNKDEVISKMANSHFHTRRTTLTSFNSEVNKTKSPVQTLCRNREKCLSLTNFDKQEAIEDEKRKYIYKSVPKVMAGIPAPSIYKYQAEAAKAKSVSQISSMPYEFRPNMGNAFYASGNVPVDYAASMQNKKITSTTPVLAERPPAMTQNMIRRETMRTPQVGVNRKAIKEIRLKARSRVFGHDGSRRPTDKGLKHENSLTMLVNAKTKLCNNNHMQNSLKEVKSQNPNALYRMMNPAGTVAGLMHR